ncbi:MAG: hypothetical protein KJO07_05575 [Deltaproteobacteria bacterium]|nr:hypothetical protein [Deltaproteobacteria bacterium]
MSDVRKQIEEREAYIATSRKVRGTTILLAVVGIVAGFIAGRWNGVVSFVLVVSSMFTIFIAAYITGMRILMFKHEIRLLEEQERAEAEGQASAASEAGASSGAG